MLDPAIKNLYINLSKNLMVSFKTTLIWALNKSSLNKLKQYGHDFIPTGQFQCVDSLTFYKKAQKCKMTKISPSEGYYIGVLVVAKKRDLMWQQWK